MKHSTHQWLRKTTALTTAIIMLMGTVPLKGFADAITAPKSTLVSNDYVTVNIDNATGRFGIRSVEGQPIRKKDQNLDMMFKGDNPETSFTTFKINGIDYIFGNPYKFAPDWFSELSPAQKTQNQDGSTSVSTKWKIDGVVIEQIITLTAIQDQVNAGNVRIEYKVKNETDAEVSVGSRILLDTSVGGNDGPAFQIGQNYMAPLQVERKLVHKPEDLGFDKTKDEAAYNLHKLPPYWVMRDVIDPTKPSATSAMAYGFNNAFEHGINVVDEMIVGHWAKMAKTKWDYTIDPNLDFTKDTNEYGTKDTAVAYYWQPKDIAAGGEETFEVVYGLGEIMSPDKVFSVKLLDQVDKVPTKADGSAYENEGIFEINAEIENLEYYKMSHSKITASLELEKGLVFVDKDGNEIGGQTSSYEVKKPISPEEAAAGIEVKPYLPGESINVKWRVKAKGKPWPTTKDYMIRVSSPETTKTIESKLSKLSAEEAKEIQSIYESSKSSFVFLPPVGELEKTYVYTMTPDEVYYSDEKHVTLSLSNIEAYNIGDPSQNVAPNFDLYFIDVQNGDRYKIPVAESVILTKTDAGKNGDMRIVYKGGALVDEFDKVIEQRGPELPLGEYRVQLVYKDKTNPEIQEYMSFETIQTFAATENEERKLREAKILAVYKTVFNLDSLNAEPREKFEEAFPEIFTSKLDNDDFAAKKLGAIAALKASKMVVANASRMLDPEVDIDEAMNLEEVPVYNIQAFEDEEAYEAFKESFEEGNDNEGGEVLVTIEGMIKQIGQDDAPEYVVETQTEPAIINGAVSYTGQDIVFSKGDFALLGGAINLPGFQKSPFLNTLYVKGDGMLAVANSGFVFHEGEWTLDFFNGYNKTLGEGYVLPPQELEEESDNPEDESLNGSLKWSNGLLGDLANPFRALMIDQVYFNLKSLFAAPNFTIGGFGLSFNDFILRDSGVSFGGGIYLKIVDGEVKNVIFNQEGFVGIESNLKFQLGGDVGLIGAPADGGEADEVGGEISIVHYVQDVGVNNSYGIKFDADLKNFIAVNAELAFKQVDDGRVLPDVIAIGSTLPEPGISVAAATYITGLRGAIRELADTIAGGSDDVPLTVEAGVDVDFGVDPAIFQGSIDLTLKRTGMELLGTLDLSVGGADPVEMLTEALIKTQWVTPWFVKAKAEINVCGWDIIVGNASIYIGENLEKHRIDFEGAVGAKLKIPGDVPVAGGMTIGRIGVGVNNDKMWGSFGVLFIEIGITYYWDGGVEFGTDGSPSEQALANLIIEDPKRGPRLMSIGQGIETLATSWETEEPQVIEIKYHSIADGVQYIDDGSQNLGVGGINVSNQGKQHVLPMNKVSGDALIEVEYFESKRPVLNLKKADGSTYPIAFTATEGQRQTAFEQVMTNETDLKGTEQRKIYIAVEDKDIVSGNWTLTSNQTVRTKLMNIPVLPKLTEINMNPDSSNKDKFTASWEVGQALASDTINLYLTPEAMADIPDPEKAVDPGLLIAKGLPVGTIDGSKVARGSFDIDLKAVEQFSGKDVRGMLGSGKYFLRAELISEKTFGTKTTVNQIDVVDPLAANPVSEVKTEAIGNGKFKLSFPGVTKKPGQENFEYSYVATALDAQGNLYKPFGEAGFDEAKLKADVNGNYSVEVGGWQKVGKPKVDAKGQMIKNPDGTFVMEDDSKNPKYVGLETGKFYTMGISVVSKPSKSADPQQNPRISAVTWGEKTLLPVVVKPSLSLNGKSFIKNQYSWLTYETEQTLSLSSKEWPVKVTAMINDKVYGSVELKEKGEVGQLVLRDFKTDGDYGIELVTVNEQTGDRSVNMLYLTVDTISPMIYLDAPYTGQRTENGSIRVKGTTHNDAKITVSDADTQKVLGELTPNAKGEFNGMVPLGAGYDKKAKVNLRLEATDRVNNSNEAVVSIVNDSFKVPVQILATEVKDLSPLQLSEPLKIELKHADGSKRVLNSTEYNLKVVKGAEVVQVSGNKLKGLRTGSALVEVSYPLNEKQNLSTMMVVSVTVKKGQASVPETMAKVGFMTAGTGSLGTTSINMTDLGHNGNMTGSEFVYKVFKKQSDVVKPVFESSLTSWTKVPVSGIIPAKQGEWVVVAKRTADETATVIGVSNPVEAINTVSKDSGGPAPTVPKGPIKIAGDSVSSIATGEGIKVGVMLDDKKASSAATAVVKKVDEKIKVEVTVDPKLNLKQFEGTKEKLSIPLEGEVDTVKGIIDVSLAKNLIDNQMAVELKTELGAYVLPAEELKKAVGTVTDGQIAITIERGSSGHDLFLAQQARTNNLQTHSVPISFNVSLEKNGGEKEIKHFDNFVERLIRLSDTAPNDITAVVLGADGTLRSVPTQRVVIDGKVYAKIKSFTNSTYAVISNHSALADVKAHWSKTYVDALFKKLIVTGSEAGKFKPDQTVTRAEFAVMLVKSLGLEKATNSKFNDVKANDWHSGYVAAAYQYGLISGTSEKGFSPNAGITREEAMTMVLKAMTLAGKPIELKAGQETLAKNPQLKGVSDWAKLSMAKALENGLIKGDAEGVAPKRKVTRAETATLIYQMLKAADLL